MLKTSIGQCHTGEGESHADKSEGFTGGHKEWRVEMEGEQVVLVSFLPLTDFCYKLEGAAGCSCDHCMNGGVACSWPSGEKHACNECIGARVNAPSVGPP